MTGTENSNNCVESQGKKSKYHRNVHQVPYSSDRLNFAPLISDLHTLAATIPRGTTVLEATETAVK